MPSVTDSAGDLQAVGQSMEIFLCLKKTGGIKEPNPPRFKQDNIPVTYMQMMIRHDQVQTSCVCRCQRI